MVALRHHGYYTSLLREFIPARPSSERLPPHSQPHVFVGAPPQVCDQELCALPCQDHLRVEFYGTALGDSLMVGSSWSSKRGKVTSSVPLHPDGPTPYAGYQLLRIID